MGIDSPDNPYQGKHDFTYKAKENDIKDFQDIIYSYNNANTV